MVRGRAVIAVVVASAMLAAVAGCTPTKKEAGMTPHEARDRLMEVVKDTSAVLDVSGWKDDGAADVQPCAADGSEGAKYAYGYSAQPGADHLGDALKVAAHWEKLGMSVRVVREPDPSVYATGGPVQGLAFSSAPGLYYIAGTSLCVPGDLTTLIDEQAGEG
jgi:hypothetical protein